MQVQVHAGAVFRGKPEVVLPLLGDRDLRLEPHDEKWIKELSKKGWEIDEFNLTSKGYELTISKDGKKVKYTDKKDPRKALETAAKKAR